MIELELTVDEINYILNVLAYQPYKDVAGMIDKIRDVSNKQLNNK